MISLWNRANTNVTRQIACDARMRRGKLPFIPVGEFYTRHAEALQLKLVGPALGFERKIREPTINRPGLALSGFFTYFAGKRIQVLGNAE